MFNNQEIQISSRNLGKPGSSQRHLQISFKIIFPSSLIINLYGICPLKPFSQARIAVTIWSAESHPVCARQFQRCESLNNFSYSRVAGGQGCSPFPLCRTNDRAELPNFVTTCDCETLISTEIVNKFLKFGSLYSLDITVRKGKRIFTCVSKQINHLNNDEGP